MPDIKKLFPSKPTSSGNPTIIDIDQSVGMAQSLVSDLRKKNPKCDIMLMRDDIESDVTEWIPSGFPNVDRILGGGWPLGRASETFGAEASGKSALADMAIVQVQKMGGIAVVEEFERTRDKRRLEKMGVDMRRLIQHRPLHAEEAWDNLWDVTANLSKQYAEFRKRRGPQPPPFLLIWDSIGGAPTKSDVEHKSEVDAMRPGVMANLMSRNCKLMFGRIQECRAHMMFINQERDSFGGTSFVKESSTPGGRALKFAASIRVRCFGTQLTESHGDKKVKVGLKCWLTTEKNKIVPPYQKSMWILHFKDGPSPALTAWHHLDEAGIIRPSTMASGKYSAPWKKDFTRGQWVELMGDPEFAEKAWGALLSAQA